MAVNREFGFENKQRYDIQNKNSPNYVKFRHEKFILIKIVTFRHENR